MRYLTYLKERYYQILILLFLLFTVGVFCITVEGGTFLFWYATVVTVGSYLLFTSLEFRKKNQYFMELMECLNQLDKKYLLPELIGRGNGQEEDLIFQILAETERSMAENVNKYRNAGEDYKEYIEMWIHEVKIPIATAKMIVENNRSLITESLEEELIKIEEYTEQALFYARSSHLEKDYLIKKINLEEIVNQALLHNKKALIAKKARIEKINLDLEVFSDGKWLVFILNQIINNSIKYADKPFLHLNFSAAVEREKITLVITDNGMGICGKDLSKVFAKGFTGENGRMGKKSTGIGLYLCQKLCGRLGHEISLESEEGTKTAARIIFPRGSFFDIFSGEEQKTPAGL